MPEQNAPDDGKTNMRTEMRSKLKALTDAERHDASVAACRRLLELPAIREGGVLMLFMPLATEIDLTPAAIRCFGAGKTVCVPKVDWARNDMQAVDVTSFDDHVMDIDEHGLRTPREGRPVVPDTIDVIVVPGLAYDVEGNRLGRGGGYYDRFLRRLRRSTVTIGLAFDLQIVDHVPADDRDVAVHTVVTERRVITPGSTRRPSGAAGR